MSIINIIRKLSTTSIATIYDNNDKMFVCEKKEVGITTMTHEKKKNCIGTLQLVNKFYKSIRMECLLAFQLIENAQEKEKKREYWRKTRSRTPIQFL